MTSAMNSPEDTLSAADSHDHVHAYEHDGPLAELVTVRDWLRYAVTRFNAAGVHCGHGCSEAVDEAVWLLLHHLRLPREQLEVFLDACVLTQERETLLEKIDKRAEQRLPMAYILNEAWLGPFRYYVDERVIVPRSFFGELLENSLSPWIDDPEAVTQALDLCTGSGCLAILMADAFPNARVTAVDLSDDALEVAARNVADYGLEKRVSLVKSDLFSKLAGRKFDLIISNPPYVTAESMAGLPQEYRHEPQMALAAGEDGLDFVRRLLAEAHDYLNPDGILAVEIGHNRDLVEKAFPTLPFTWLTTQGGDDMIFMLHREELPAAQSSTMLSSHRS